jgi:uncharacterized membrane protein YoaK (UPF0700 family)
MTERATATFADDPSGIVLLLGVLSFAAGSVDAIGFLMLGGLFTAHVTGNLVVLAAHVATGRVESLARILAVPMFVVAVALTRLLTIGLDETRQGSLRLLLVLHLVLIVGLLTICVAAGGGLDPRAPIAVVAGMVGVSAMAVQNALVRISLIGAPATTVMTTDIATFVLDICALLFLRDSNEISRAGNRARRTGSAIAGFIVGCSLGAGLEALIGPWCLMLPAILAALALVLGFSLKESDIMAISGPRSVGHS